MELTNRHLEKVRVAARGIRYGSVTINISEASDKLELVVNNRMRFDDEPGEEEKPKPKRKIAVKKT